MSKASPAAERVRRSFRNVLRHFIVLAAGLLIVCVAGSAAAQTQDDDPFDRPGFYFGAGGVYQRNVFENKIEDSIDDSIEDINIGGSNLSVSNFRLDIGDSGGLNLLAGYRAASFFAAELEYEWVDRYDVDVSGRGTFTSGPLAGQSADVSGKLYSIEGHTLTLNTKWIIPFWRIQPYATIGAGLSVYDLDRGDQAADILELLTEGDLDVGDGTEAAFAGRLGGGIDWYITKNILLNTYCNFVLTTRNFKTPSEENADDLNYVGFGGNLQYRF